nr:interleukin-23 receptor [Misgurnus anguillicaudatus]
MDTLFINHRGTGRQRHDMDIFIGVCQVVFLLLFNLNLCGCYRVVCAGRLIVESDIIHMGTSLTVHCQSSTERCGRQFAIDIDGQTVFEISNCSVITTKIIVNQPNPRVLCKVKENNNWHLVCRQNLKAGYPPSKPTKFACITHRHSEYVNCSMGVLTETHLLTNYTVQFKHERTSQSLLYEMKNGHVSIPRSVFNETMTYQVHVKGRNALGEANSTFTFSVLDSVIPSTPEITKVEFKNHSFIIHWKSDDDPSAKPDLRFRSIHNNQDWGLGSVIELQAGLIQMQESLVPFIPYQLELRVCVTSANCSMWSRTFNITIPGKAPSSKLDVWRVITKNTMDQLQDVTVFWKPYTPDNNSGGLLQYKLSYKEKGRVHELNCSAHVTHYTLRLSLKVTEINVSAVTSSGSSPSAPVNLLYTGKPAPIITHLSPAPGGAMRLGWDLSHYREGLERIMGIVIQWQQSPMALQWKRLGKDYNNTFLEGMQDGVLYNISLYIEETSGISYPAFRQVYSKEKKPLGGPDVSINPVGDKHILIEWKELDQEKQRGFITHYTIYFQRHKNKMLLQNTTLPSAFPRSLSWKLQDPLESFDVLVSAWNSAGEGPKGKASTCYIHRSLTCGKMFERNKDTDKMIAGFCLVAAVPMVILANLMYLKCVRQRMMKMCMSMGVSWLFENLPKFDNSNAIKLLKDESYSAWESLPWDNDPPLTPVEEVNPSWERQDSYPTVLHEDVPETPVERQSCIECPYKPQRTEDVYETTEEEVKEDDEDQFSLLMSPSPVPYDFSWDLTSIPVINSRLNSFLTMDGGLGSLSVLGSFLSTPHPPSHNDEGMENDGKNVEADELGQSSFISQTVHTSDMESCLINSSPYSPQGICFRFLTPEDV